MENKKVIFVSNHAGFAKFNIPYIDWLQCRGVQVDNASPFLEDYAKSHINVQYDIPISRQPYSIGNFKAIGLLHKLFKKEHYDLIHCHTPMGAVVARLASFGIPNTKILYTAHGYFFYKGAPLVNWLLYFPIEFILKFKTDYLVTINNEDYRLANKFKMARKGIFHIDGIGYSNKFIPAGIQERNCIKEKLGISDSFSLLYTAQFIERKNHRILMDSLPEIIRLVPELKMLFVGSGELYDEMVKLSEQLGINQNVIFLGERTDVETFCKASDIYVSTSRQEGLALGAVEAMACGCPLVLSKIRGHIDFCVEGKNGFMFNIDDKSALIDSIIKIYRDKELRENFIQNNIIDAQKFRIENSLSAMGSIYSEILNI